MFSLDFYLCLLLFTRFSLPYLHLIAYTYLHSPIYTCVLFTLLYVLEKKLIKYKECRNNDEIF